MLFAGEGVINTRAEGGECLVHFMAIIRLNDGTKELSRPCSIYLLWPMFMEDGDSDDGGNCGK